MDRPCSSIRSSDERVTATPYRSILLEQNATVGCDLREIFHGDHRVALVYDDDGAQNDTTPTKPQTKKYLSRITSCYLIMSSSSTSAEKHSPSQHPLGNLKVGDTATFERTMKSEYTNMYAEITGDKNPLHFDEEYAKSTRFDGLVCHGGLASGMLNSLVAEELPGPGSVFMKQELDYTAPTRPGDTLIATGKVTWVHESKPVCHMDVSVKVKSTDVEVLKGKVVVYRMLPKTPKTTTATTNTEKRTIDQVEGSDNA